MMREFLALAAAVFIAGAVFMEFYVEAPSRNTAGTLLAASMNPALSDESLLPCPDTFVYPETEGPYYKTGSPERRDLIEEGIPGEIITVTGYVFDMDCRSISGAWIDFWQADGNGNYDNRGYKLRGHQFTDEHGRYMLRTVLPGEYPGRTNHIHVKVRGGADGPVITSQLFFPGSRRNTSDRIFHPSMLVTVTVNDAGEKQGAFNFRLNQ